MILYFLSEINPDPYKLNIELEYSNKTIYDRGFNFSDSIDHIVRYQNDGEIPKIGDTFHMLVCEIFFMRKSLN